MRRHAEISVEERLRRPVAAIVGAGLALVIVAGACTGDGATPGSPVSPASEASPAAAETSAATIPQPEVSGISVAPESQRVDLVMPTFSDPTNVTNPLFPVSSQESVLLLGRVDGKDFRTEVTLLPETRIIEWSGVRVEVLVSQYVAYLDGRLHEVAYDLYAQDDAGNVWYFGEDVFNFGDGSIVDTHGTWIAGKDGNAAMIMPADPQVGDVYRPENIPGFVFEEVTVKAVDQTLAGPLGPVEGGLLIEELHMDGFTEDKTFGPGYGEFLTGGGGDVEAIALAVPTDSLSGSTPPELEALSGGALTVFEAAGSRDWTAAAAALDEISAAWDRVRAGDVPKRLAPRLGGAIDAMGSAVDARDVLEAREAAIDAAMWSFDLQLRYRPAVEIDLARFDLWLAQLQVDAAAGDAAAMNGDFFALDYIRDRILQALDPADAASLNLQLEELLGAVGEAKFRAAGVLAEEIRGTVASFRPLT